MTYLENTQSSNPKGVTRAPPRKLQYLFTIAAPLKAREPLGSTSRNTPAPILPPNAQVLIL